jgi:hypothetical protein
VEGDSRPCAVQTEVQVRTAQSWEQHDGTEHYKKCESCSGSDHRL